jgi:hypothetical protein
VITLHAASCLCGCPKQAAYHTIERAKRAHELPDELETLIAKLEPRNRHAIPGTGTSRI